MKSGLDPRRARVHGDTLPDQHGVYVPPRPIAPLSEHRTMDIKAIRLAAELDPRQAMTELRLQAPPRPRRGVSLLAVVAALLVVLFGVGAYVTFATETPLPLVTSDPPREAPAVALPAAPAAPAADTNAPPPPTAEVAPVLPAAPPSTAADAPLSTPADPEPSVTSTAMPRSSAPRRTKATRDPWLE